MSASWRKPHLVIALLALVIPSGAHAQARNDRLIEAQKANDNFEPQRAMRILTDALDPSQGPADSAWASGVQLLTQILIDDHQDSLAMVWSRWALRLKPGLSIDTVTFLPQAVATLQAARQFVGSPTPGDSVTGTQWGWAVPGSSDTQGHLLVAPSAQAPQIVVVGVGVAMPGESLTLPPGSYQIEASANGFVSARVTRELLPGVTTALAFELKPSTAVPMARAKPVTPTPANAPPPPLTPEQLGVKKKGHFPILPVALGAAAVGGLVVILGGKGHSSSTPSTGGITISIPNPQ